MSSERVAGQGVGSHSEPFLYLPTVQDGRLSESGSVLPMDWNLQGTASKADVEQHEKEAFGRGVQEGEARARAAFDQQLAILRASIAHALEEFKSQKESYFSRIEPEIVQLALGIARKILHREAQMDPLLLTGMVHVALEKLDDGTRVRLRAHPGDVHFWNEYFSTSGSVQPSPEIIGDPALQHGECALETEIGSTQISLETQLKEIEQGFFDLLDQRPRVR